MARFLGPAALIAAALSLLLAPLEAAPRAATAWPDLRTVPVQGGGEKDAAVVIGVSDYAYVPDVPGAATNATEWVTWLRRGRHVPLARIRLLRDAEATDVEIRRAAAAAAERVDPGGTLWFVFIGHGAPSRDGTDGVLVGHDAKQQADALYARSVSRSDLLGTLARGRQARTVVVLDACFSGRASGEGGALVEDMPVVPAALPAIEVADTLVLSAGGPDEFAGPLPGLGRPAFSYLIVGGLRGWADQNEDSGNRDGQVTAREAVDYATVALRALLKGRAQTPRLEGDAPDGVLTARATESGPDLLAMMIDSAGETVRPPPMPPASGEPPSSFQPETAVPVEVTSRPTGAIVRLDGRDLGKTPWTGFVRPGESTIELILPRFRAERRVVRLEPQPSGGLQRILVELAADFGTLVVDGPPGAELLLDGQRLGTTPWKSGPVAPGVHVIEVRAERHVPVTRTVTLDAGEVETISIAPSPRVGALHILARTESGASFAADVWIDGRKAGRTPLLVDRMLIGPHRVEVRDPGGRLQAAAEDVTVEERGTIRRLLTLTASAAEARPASPAPASAPDDRRAALPAPPVSESSDVVAPQADAWLPTHTLGAAGGGLLVVGGLTSWLIGREGDLSPPSGWDRSDPGILMTAGMALGAAATIATLVHYLVADPPTTGAAPRDPDSPMFDFAVGFLGGGGFDVWSSPNGTKRTYTDFSGGQQTFDIPIFDETRAGAGYSLGLSAELRLWTYLGVEVDVLLAWDHYREKREWTYTEVDLGTGQIERFTTETEQRLSAFAVRIPILVKGILPVHGTTRLFLGIGPEVIIGTSTGATFEVIGGDPPKGTRATFQALYSAEPDVDVYVTGVFGVEGDLGPVRLSTQLRFSHNPSQPRGYYDRLRYSYQGPEGGGLPWETGDPTDHPTHGEVRVQSSYAVQLLVGAQYVF